MKFTRNPNKLPQKLNKLELIIKVGVKKEALCKPEPQQCHPSPKV